MTPTLRTRALAATIAGLALAASLGVSPASAKAGDVRVAGTCNRAATTKLKLGPRDGRIETETEVDSNRNGQVWSVRMRQNGVLVLDTTATTGAPSGSFSVRKVLANKAGADTIQVTSRNANTGQTCTATATL